jgi:uncharacterized alpha-E superfamily protein
MAVTTKNVVVIRLRPVMDIDDRLDTDIDLVIEEQIAVRGWDAASLTDPQAVYVGLLALRSLIPRLITHAMNELQSAVSGEERQEWENRAQLLKLMAKQVEEELEEVAAAADPEEVEEQRSAPPPLAGVREI